MNPSQAPIPPIRVCIVDDHPVVRDGLKGMLTGQPGFALAGEAANGEEALRQVEQHTPQVVLMDLHMPVLDGAAATALIRQRFPAVRVLILTTYDSDAEILKAIEAGATGYILKDAPREELFRAIRATAQGQSYLSPAVASRLMGQLRTPTQDMLTPRELDVLTWVARGASNKQIGQHLHISEATVKSHLLHIFEKLAVSDRTQAVTLALQKGLIRLTSE
jgi:DNA-binding NarL/FixJ family response regulator